jgi:hypothetical protein
MQWLYKTWVLISCIQLQLVLRLHASTHRAPHEVGDKIKNASCFLHSVDTDRDAREDAGQILEKKLL